MADISEVAQYWDSRPCNVRHSPLPVGTKEYFDQVAQRKYLVESHIPRFAQFERWAGKDVLEIGCGIGTDTMSFARAGARVVAVDLSMGSLEIAKRRADVYGLTDRVTFINANAEELCSVLSPRHFDLVYSFGVVHHTPNPRRAVESAMKYMGPDSTLKLMVYNRLSWKAIGIFLRGGWGRFWAFDRVVARHSEAQDGCPHTATYTRRSVAKLLDGLQIKECCVEHIFPWRIPEYKAYRYRMAWPFCWMSMPVFKWLEARLGWHLCVTAVRP